MESVFYKYGYKKRFPVTYLFLELFTKSLENSESDASIEEVLLPVLSSLGKKPPYDEAFLEQVLNDLHDFRKAKDEAVRESKSSSDSKRTFGKEFLKWFSQKDTEEILFLLTSYDFNLAYKIYSEVPVTAVEKMIKTKLGYEWTVAEKDFEAVVYGMGGSLKGGSSGGKTFSQPKTEEEEKVMANQLKKLGF